MDSIWHKSTVVVRGRYKNAIKISVTHSAAPCVPLLLFFINFDVIGG